MIRSKETSNIGLISAIKGTLIEIKGLENIVKLHDLIKVSSHKILGEIIQIYVDHIVAQCYENTNNLKLNDEVLYLNEPLSMELGPGLLSGVFDGIQRPLDETFKSSERKGFISRGLEIPALSRTKKWSFKPLKKIGDLVYYGDTIGTVQETPSIIHKILVPIKSGNITSIVEKGEYTVTDDIYSLSYKNQERSFNLIQKWPVTKSRPYKARIIPSEPLLTGIRVIDLLFPIAKGGTVAVPGGFGTGKTVIQQSLARWCNADIVVFVGCGERGNEIADVLKEFSEITDPKSGRPLLERIVLIANTSNMPVSAREASIFSGITIAEYYRDMGYDVAVLADSTSRWAESLREISGLLEEMPAEEGYPAYLPSKLSSFYERAGIIKTLGNSNSEKENYGSITIIGSVSPPAGDFSEPVTSTSKRFVQAFWALDAQLAYSKHYPAINWLNSYSNYPEYLSDWWFERDIDWKEVDVDWLQCRSQVEEILSKEQNLINIVQLVGVENLPSRQQLILFIAKIIRESFLIQNAFNIIDSYTDARKLLGLIKLILLLYNEANQLLKQGFSLEDIKNFQTINEIMRINRTIPNNEFTKIESIKEKLLQEIESLKIIHGVKTKK
jgi:V/A-type H+-transporting ATPase subunit A